MSYQATLDQGEGIQLASNQGYYELSDWLESLDPDQYPKLAFLAEEGYNQPAGEVADELEKALEADEPDEDVVSTARGLIAYIRQGDPDAALVISQGIGEGEGEGESEEDEDEAE